MKPVFYFSNNVRLSGNPVALDELRPLLAQVGNMLYGNFVLFSTSPSDTGKVPSIKSGEFIVFCGTIYPTKDSAVHNFGLLQNPEDFDADKGVRFSISDRHFAKEDDVPPVFVKDLITRFNKVTLIRAEINSLEGGSPA